jgi:hypothetical protein
VTAASLSEGTLGAPKFLISVRGGCRWLQQAGLLTRVANDGLGQTLCEILAGPVYSRSSNHGRHGERGPRLVTYGCRLWQAANAQGVCSYDPGAYMFGQRRRLRHGCKIDIQFMDVSN